MSAETTPTSSAPFAIIAERVSKTFGSGERQIAAVDDVSFKVPQGTITALVGRSGSGKSTLLNLLGALDRPTTGEVVVHGQRTGDRTDSELTRLRQREIGFVFQQFNLIPNLSAMENVELPMEFTGTPRASRRERALRLLDDVGLGHRTHHRPGKLSGGEQQRVAIARALANDPPLLLADEPTGNLDSRTGSEVIDLLTRLVHQHGKTLLLVTHDEGLAAAADLRLHLSDGRMLAAADADRA